MKVPKSEFIQFKKEFLRMRDLLNLRCYRVHFEFRPLLNDAYAEITTNQSGLVAVVSFPSELSKNSFGGRCSPEMSAKHEVAHLLISKLTFLAEERFATSIEISDENERIVRILEQVL